MVTDRDRVAAELVPPATGRGQVVDDVALAGLVREGLLTPPLIKLSGEVPRHPVARFKSLLEELDHDRADR
ncbi:MAG: hypothetical protein ABSD20_11960 [Terriglobales bacterium]